MSIVAEFECYDILGELQPKQKYTIESSFNCGAGDYVLGIWVKAKDDSKDTQVIPMYLTQEQLNQVVDQWNETND
jgi:hypothetical protein